MPEIIDEEEEFDFMPEAEARPEERGFLENQARRAKRYGARAAESVVGLPGDIVQTVRSMAQSIPDVEVGPFKIRGGLQPEEEQNFVQRWGRKALESLPGSGELRAKTAESFPDLEPESEAEDVEDEIVGDLAALAIPVKGKIPFARALGLSLIGNAGKQAMKEMGFGGTAQEATKMGLMIFGGMFGKGRGARTYMNNLYKQAEGFVPKGAKFKYPMKGIEKVEGLIAKGAMNDAKAPVAAFIEDMRGKMPSGVMTVEEAMQFDRDLSREIARSANDPTKRGLYKQLKKAHLNAVDEYAKENKAFGETWNDAKMAYKGLETGMQIQDFVKKNANVKNLTYSAALLGMQEAALPGHTGTKLAALGGAATTLYSAEVAKRIAKNPALRRYYQNVVQASLSDNAAMLNRNIQGLERAAKKEFEENPLPMFDLDEEDDDF